MPFITPTAFRKPASGGKAKQLVLILHGWGADGANLIDLADMFARALPDAHFIAPNAPFVCEVNPYGFQWFSLMNRHPQHMLDGARKAAESLNEFIDEQLAELSVMPDASFPHELASDLGKLSDVASSPKESLDTSQFFQERVGWYDKKAEGEGLKVALVGFSQGTMTALHVALRRTPQISAVVGFSGALIGAEVLAKEITARPPICLIHGNADDVVPYASLAHATETLRNHGCKVEPHTRPFVGHSIDMEGIAIAAEFLKDKLG